MKWLKRCLRKWLGIEPVVMQNFVIAGVPDRLTAEQIARMSGKQARRDIGRS